VLEIEACEKKYTETLASLRKRLEDHYAATFGSRTEAISSLIVACPVEGDRVKSSLLIPIQPLSELEIAEGPQAFIRIIMPLAVVVIIVDRRTGAGAAYIERDGYFEYCYVGFTSTNSVETALGIIGEEAYDVAHVIPTIGSVDPHVMLGTDPSKIWTTASTEEAPELEWGAYGPVIPYPLVDICKILKRMRTMKGLDDLVVCISPVRGCAWMRNGDTIEEIPDNETEVEPEVIRAFDVLAAIIGIDWRCVASGNADNIEHPGMAITAALYAPSIKHSMDLAAYAVRKFPKTMVVLKEKDLSVLLSPTTELSGLTPVHAVDLHCPVVNTPMVDVSGLTPVHAVDLDRPVVDTPMVDVSDLGGVHAPYQLRTGVVDDSR
jgi:hypothetical protein